MHAPTLRRFRNLCGLTGFSSQLARPYRSTLTAGIGALSVGLGTAGAVLLAAAGGCEREEVRAYQVPKEPSSKAMAQGPASPSQLGNATGLQSGQRTGVVWTLPQGWTERPATQAMRIATIETGVGGVAGAGSLEIAVTAFPGDVGGRLANVNRWRGQMGQSAITDAELPGALKELTEVRSKDAPSTGATRVWTTLIQSGSGGGIGAGNGTQAMLGAIIEPGDGQTWFLKCLGPRENVEPLRPAFESFALTFRLGGTGGGLAPASGPDGSSPASVAPSATNVTPAAAVTSISQRLSTWQAPATWAKDEAGAGQFAAIAYNTSSDQGAARVTVTSLQGDGGGMLANINRWRGQVGLSPVANEKDQPSQSLAPGVTLFDMAKQDGSDRMIAAVLSEAGGTREAMAATWYFKLRGSSKAVESQAGVFEAFVRAVGIGDTGTKGGGGSGGDRR